MFQLLCIRLDNIDSNCCEQGLLRNIIAPASPFLTAFLRWAVCCDASDGDRMCASYFGMLCVLAVADILTWVIFSWLCPPSLAFTPANCFLTVSLGWAVRCDASDGDHMCSCLADILTWVIFSWLCPLSPCIHPSEPLSNCIPRVSCALWCVRWGLPMCFLIWYLMYSCRCWWTDVSHFLVAMPAVSCVHTSELLSNCVPQVSCALWRVRRRFCMCFLIQYVMFMFLLLPTYWHESFSHSYAHCLLHWPQRTAFLGWAVRCDVSEGDRLRVS
jgi:hypothetical protein